MLKKIAITVSYLFLVTFLGCAGLTHQKNTEALQRVKKVAIIGFTVQEPAPAGIGVSLNSGRVGAVAGGSMIGKSAAEVNEMYADLAQAFGKNLNWTVMPASRMKHHPGYQAAYDRTMKGWQNKMPPGRGEQRYFVPDIMDNDGMRILGTDGRTALIQALGVDAIITAHVNVFISGTTVGGFGTRYPRSRLSFQLYMPGKNAPDWFEGNVLGEQSKTSLGATAFWDEGLLNRLALQSARTAYAKISLAEN